jgi:hypothetical protein
MKVCAHQHTDTPLLVREPKEAIYGYGSLPGIEETMDIMDVLGVKRGPFSGNRGPDSNLEVVERAF